MVKTNAMRLLTQAGINYEVIEYEVDEENLAGVHVAEQTGLPVEQVFKTFVARGEKRGCLVFCIPVAEELDLKKAAQAVGDKKIELVHVK
ncbi:MAG: Cys-tRNA(Pro) deacylase, partial [Lachnospiraceae bacterium]|nr:Cys-tRNA(Pro) deacylase [Lachnospiraceae bacterium]